MFVNIPIQVQEHKIKDVLSKKDINQFDLLMLTKNKDLYKESKYKSKIFKINVLKNINFVEKLNDNQLSIIVGKENVFSIRKAIKEIKEKSLSYKKFEKEVSHLVNIGQSRTVIEGEIFAKVEELRGSFKHWIEDRKNQTEKLGIASLVLSILPFTGPGAIMSEVFSFRKYRMKKIWRIPW